MSSIAPSTDPAKNSAEPKRSLRILWISCRLLHPLNGGDRIRTYNMLKEFKRRHHVTYLCLRTPKDTEETVQRATEFCHEVIPVAHASTGRTLRFYVGVLKNTFVGKYPFIAKKYESPETVARLREMIARKQFDLVICDYLSPMINLLGLGQKPPVPTIIFQHNIESLIWKRHVDCVKNPIKRFIYKKEWELTHRFEDTCAEFVDGQVTVSEDEYHYFKDTRKMKGVLGAVPTGVDCEYYQPNPNAEPHTMAFLGSMDWHANLDAVQYFVGEVYPKIKARFPDAKFLIIGRNPPASIRALSDNDRSIEVTGTVADVRPFLSRASTMVLPLRVGGGTRIKVFEAMAAGLAVVSTHVGAEGLPVEHDEHIVFADQPDEFADGVCKVLGDPAFRQRISNNALELVRAQFSWKAAVDIFERHCFKILKNKEQI
jgi:polysaccharide biosynthesis protein PslH